jgi:hypothetical protein
MATGAEPRSGFDDIEYHFDGELENGGNAGSRAVLDEFRSDLGAFEPEPAERHAPPPSPAPEPAPEPADVEFRAPLPAAPPREPRQWLPVVAMVVGLAATAVGAGGAWVAMQSGTLPFLSSAPTGSMTADARVQPRTGVPDTPPDAVAVAPPAAAPPVSAPAAGAPAAGARSAGAPSANATSAGEPESARNAPAAPAVATPATPAVAAPAVAAPSVTAPAVAAPAVATPAVGAPATPVSASGSAERAAVDATLANVSRAYRALDASALQRDWPGADVARLSTEFDGLKYQSLSFDRCEVRSSPPAQAIASCAVVRATAPRSGDQALRRVQETWTIVLSRTGDRYVIAGVTTR